MKRLIAKLDSFETTSVLKNVFDLNTILSDGLELTKKDNTEQYQQFNNCSVEEFFNLIANSKLANYITEQVNKVNNTNLTYNDIVDFVINDYMCNNACTEWLKNVMYELHNTENDYGFGSTKKIKNISELENIDDAVGDKIEIPQKLDFNNRDKAFIYIAPNTLLISGKNESHTQMLDKYLNTKSNDDKTRKTDKELSDENIEQVSFGHIIDDIAFIETLQNVSLEDVVQSLLDKYNKIYFYDDKNKIVERLQ